MATPNLLTDAATDADAPDLPADAIEVGRIGGPWGVKGAFKVQPHAAAPQALFSSRRWFLQDLEPLRGGVAARAAARPRLLRITQVREQGSLVVATAQEVSDRTAAQALQGARVFVSRTSFPSAGEGEYYWVDLIGLAVINRDAVCLGQVTDLIDTGVHSVLLVRRPDLPADAPAGEAERLIPFVAAYIDGVDLQARQIRVDWGLDY
jgi:16S rRNA processing protein RimM